MPGVTTSTLERGTGAPTLAAMVAAMASRPGPALRFKRDGAWTEMSYHDLGVAAREIAGGLITLGIAPGDRVAILSATRPEWTLADFGATTAGATVVPVYDTNSPEECKYVLEHSDARAVFCADASQLDKIDAIRGDLPLLEHVIAFDDAGERALSLEALRELGAGVDEATIAAAAAAVTPDDLATVIYTSGTTGPPKGCQVTHANWTSTIRMYEERLDLAPGDPAVIFLFLPLAHSLARITQIVALDVGGTLAFWSGTREQVLDDIVQARPTHLPSVPRVFEKIHAKAHASAEEGGRLKQLVFDWAVAAGRRARALERSGVSAGALFTARLRVADRLVLSKVRGLFGPDLRLALTGAAPIAPEILEFFDACGVLVVEGYGMTETCAAATLNTPEEFRFGTVGRPLGDVEVRIAADGEILMRGPNVFRGYYKNDEATSETFDGDWLCSGDLGEIDADGYLRVTGRKKELIITSSGKNISPANIEMALRETGLISQAVVFGDNKPYLVALLTLDPDALPGLAARCDVEPDMETMARDPRVRAELQAAIDQVNKRLARIEQIKRFDVLEHDLTQESGELTPTLKVKHNLVYERYRDRFEALYRDGR